ncbi:MAG: helix-turn-helix domain-containing protein [Streptococcaceae bacterium]|nr:helix-turn-helix domain-containing protein [Streptococcaceae bacterium]
MVQKAIGPLLKERRTKLDWSLDKAEKQTSIKKIYISALETGNIGIFPGPFYVRAYLKQYAQRLELDVDAILEAYDKGVPVEVEGPFEDTGNYRFIRPDEREILLGEEDTDEEPKNWFQRYMPVVLLSSFAIIILAAVALIVVLNYPRESAVSPDNYSTSQSSVSSSQSSSDSSSSSSAATSLSHSTDGATILVKSGTKSVVLTFTLKTGIATATASVSGTVSQTANLTASQNTAAITLEENVAKTTLTLSDYKSLNIQINGQALDLSDVPNPPNTLTLEITY